MSQYYGEDNTLSGGSGFLGDLLSFGRGAADIVKTFDQPVPAAPAPKPAVAGAPAASGFDWKPLAIGAAAVSVIVGLLLLLRGK